jgi:DNA-directed RNA polymerase subunit RPC12/RpoP
MTEQSIVSVKPFKAHVCVDCGAELSLAQSGARRITCER